MTKKNDVLSAKNPCKNGVKIEMDQLDFDVNFVIFQKQENVRI